MKLSKDRHQVNMLVVTLLASVFFGELLVMVLIDQMQAMPVLQEALFDASLLALICYPLLYFLAFRPLRLRIAQHEIAEEQLFASNLELRTHQHELEHANFELKRTNLALQESKQRFDDLFNFAPVGCLILTTDGAILEANVTSEKLLGAARDRIINRNFIAFVPNQEYAQWALCIREVLGDASRCSHKLILKRDDGSQFYALMNCSRGNPLLSSEIYAAFIDITQENWSSYN